MGMDVDDDAMMMMMILLFIIMDDIETEEEQSTARKHAAHIVSYNFFCRPVYHIKGQICSWKSEGTRCSVIVLRD